MASPKIPEATGPTKIMEEPTILKTPVSLIGRPRLVWKGDIWTHKITTPAHGVTVHVKKC